MFKKRLRLKSNKDRMNLLRRGRRLQRDGLFLYMQENNDGNAHVAVTVGKKFDGRAVKRNRQKRILLAALREVIDTDAPCNFLITYTKKGKMLSYKEAKEVLEKMMPKG